MKPIILITIVFSLLLTVASPVGAVDIAPRISDREIIESLTRLETQVKEGQKALKSEMNIRFGTMDTRFEAMNIRFDAINNRLNILITVLVLALGFLFRMQWQMNRRQAHMETSLETQKDEIAWLKEMINKLLPPKGVL